jgi:phospholipid-transporting ATPase
LAIGDGGNDVSMIMEANIGIGVQGEEGVSAVQASDFSIGEFKILKKLLFIHGRVNLYRISNMILYFFFKNCVFTMVQFYFAFLNLGSGQTFIDDWYITCYNLIFTALPLCISALTDSDINIYNKKVKKNLSLLYKESRDNYRIFTFGRFIFNIFKGAIISLLIFITCCVKQLLSKNGFFANIWFISLKSYMCVLFVVSSNLLLTNNFIVIYLPLSILISTFCLFFIFLVLNHYGILFEFNSKGTILASLSSPILYCSVFFMVCLSIVTDYSQKLLNLFFNESLIMRMNLRKAVKKKEKRRSSIIPINNISSKSSNNNQNSIIANKKKSQELTKINKGNFEKTSNILLPKSTNYIFTKIKKIDFQESKSNKYQDNAFTLKFRNKNNVINYKNINKN